MAALPGDIREVVARALTEDILDGDVTASLIPEDREATAMVIGREAAVLCGTAWFDEVFVQLDPEVSVTWTARDGDPITPGQMLCTIEGPARPILSGERTALNFLQTLSGTATLASRYAAAVAGTGTRVLDTRKTLPGLRTAQKYAVRCGGCHNHRMGLYDAILIKENHIQGAGSIGAALEHARRLHPALSVEVEVEDLEQLREAVQAGAEIVLLDNFDPARMREAVAWTQGRAKLEVSGGVGLDQVRAIAETGVDYLSVGALTKHVQAVDFSMRFI